MCYTEYMAKTELTSHDLLNLLDNYMKNRGKIKKIKPNKSYINKKKLKTKHNKPKRIKRKKLQDFADSLEKNLPKSEIWFRSLYEKHLKIHSDIYNRPLTHFIPDITNFNYRYIIEIDGSYHDSEEQKAKDLIKDKFYKKKKFKVFRVQAYNDASYIRLIYFICNIRKINTINDQLKSFLLTYGIDPDSVLFNK